MQNLGNPRQTFVRHGKNFRNRTENRFRDRKIDSETGKIDPKCAKIHSGTDEIGSGNAEIDFTSGEMRSEIARIQLSAVPVFHNS